MRALISQFVRVGAVGLVGLVIDVGIFNLLRATVLNPDRVADGALWATLASTSVAIVFNWLGNRYWTFRKERRRHWWREGIEFAIVSIGGLLIALGCVWFSEHVLGLHSLLSDNVAKNVVGLALGTIFRFTFYRLWVFRPERPDSPALTLPEPAIVPDASIAD
ncbi:MAG TPA: GtrA family protein [Galbitalea sp.]|jgi:putative flippase GtrA|nr:GtrA family protein [Galbitalea sp.]